MKGEIVLEEERITKDINVKRLSVKEVLAKPIPIYKAGFKQFIGLASLSLVTVVCLTAFEVAINYSLAIALFILIILFGSLYINFRANVGLYKLARSLTQGIRLTTGEAFRCSKGLAGTYFAVSFLYMLIIIVPVFGIALSYMFAENDILKCVLILIFGIPFAFLYTRYYLAMPSALISGRQNGEFKSSMQLVKGDFWSVLSIIVLTFGIFSAISQSLIALSDSLESGFWSLVFFALLECAILVLTSPISTIAAMIMYITLNDIKGIDMLFPEAVQTEEI
jgi:hypothetical protein